MSGCEKPHLAKGYCSMHWQRVKAWGHPGEAKTLRPRGILNQIEDKFLVGDGCWEWTAARYPSGYGFLNVNGVPKGAHIVLYELMVGPVPEGLELDHLCRNPPCVRPSHLEPVTHLENVRRAMRDECKNGHLYTPETVYIRPDKGTRMCRECSRIRDRNRKRKVGS